MKRILVATDGTDLATRAVVLAAEQAIALKAALTIVHVRVPLAPGLNAALASEYEWAEQTSSQNVLAAAGTLARQKGADVETRSLYGQPAVAIVNEAEHQHFDLVVLGSHGRRGLQKALLGSVADRVLHTCHCPVLISR